MGIPGEIYFIDPGKMPQDKELRERLQREKLVCTWLDCLAEDLLYKLINFIVNNYLLLLLTLWGYRTKYLQFKRMSVSKKLDMNANASFVKTFARIGNWKIIWYCLYCTITIPCLSQLSQSFNTVEQYYFVTCLMNIILIYSLIQYYHDHI